MKRNFSQHTGFKYVKQQVDIAFKAFQRQMRDDVAKAKGDSEE